MKEESRRAFLKGVSQLSAAAALPAAAAGASAERSADRPRLDERIRLDGAWQFRLDPDARGEPEGWNGPEIPSQGWTEVLVPHTWQIVPQWSGYMGVAWYRRSFEAPPDWAGCAVRIEFEAVFHSATVWVNGVLVGKHTGKGYTGFTLDVFSALRFNGDNTLAVRVDNAFNESMLPRGDSSDWTHDGGVYRPVSLIVTPQTFIERVDVDAVPDIPSQKASLEIAVAMRNTGKSPVDGQISYRVVEERSGKTVLRGDKVAEVRLDAGKSRRVALPEADFAEPKLWHFDHPHLYRLVVEYGQHSFAATFGVRSFEVKDGGFYLNTERVFLMGVERMGGSHPDFGMAEPEELLVHDHNEMKELNCVFTRVHWQQDKRVLDYCDRRGIMIQLEVPTWGPGTFKGMSGEPAVEIMQNGLEQLREMIQRERNHPCIFAWGLCNEIGGQNPPAYQFAKRMFEEARRLDPRRPLTYASNSLQKTPEKDVSALMDFVEWNEYYETWFGGGIEDLRRNLEAIQKAFPGKPLVISEYGWCSCTSSMPEDDSRRIEVLLSHNAVFREFPSVAGLIYFCYNDYRTHKVAKGRGVMRQRGGGVVDLYGRRKQSFDILRRESSPIGTLEFRRESGVLTAFLRTRNTVPAYRLSGYKLKWVAYGDDGSPVEQHEAALPVLDPGEEAAVPIRFEEPSPTSVRVEVVRPTGFSAHTAVWRP